MLKRITKKGLVKIKNFKTHPNKIGYAYLLTPKGILEKTKITINFMKRKMEEYEELREELEKSKKNQRKKLNIFIVNLLMFR